MSSGDEVAGGLSPAEARLVGAVREGGRVVFDPADGPTTLRAVVLRAVICGGSADGKAPGPVEIQGGTVEGPLDLRGAELPARVALVDMHFDEPLVLSQAKTRDLDLTGSVLPAFVGERLLCDGDLVLDGVRVADGVRLTDAVITGSVRCSKAFLRATSGPGLVLDDAWIRRDINCVSTEVHGADGSPALVGRRLVVDGDALLMGVVAGGVDVTWAEMHTFRCTGAQLSGVPGLALCGDGMRVTRGVFLDRGFRAEGAVSFLEANAGDELNCTGGRFECPDGHALDGKRLTVRRIYLDHGFRATGTVCFDRANVEEHLTCTGGNFSNDRGAALRADGLACGGDVYLNKGVEGRFRASGTVSLIGASIGRQLNCTGGRFDGDPAILADGLACRDVYLNAHGATPDDAAGDHQPSERDEGRFHATGTVSLNGASIGRQLNCTGAKLEADQADAALAGKSLRCSGTVYMNDGFCADGTILLEHARIDGDLRCDGGRFRAGAGCAIAARRLSVDGTLAWNPVAAPNGRVDFADASLGRLEDSPTSWPSGAASDDRSLTILQGLAFRSCTKWTAEERKAWLREAEFAPQVYEQLSRIYRQIGQESDAVDIDIARLKDFRSRGGLTLPRRAWNWFLEKSVGYGYWLHRPVAALLLLGLVGSIIFNYAQHHDIMSAASNTTTGSVSADDCTADYPCFNPYVYSFELLLPVVNLRQVTYWIPNVNADWGLAVAAYFWFAILIGWVMAAALVAGISRVVNRS